MSGGVGSDEGALAIGQDGLTSISDEGESIRKASSADGADETSDNSKGELHGDLSLTDKCEQ